MEHFNSESEAINAANLNKARKAFSSRPELSGLAGFDTFTGVINRVKPCAWKDSAGPWCKEDDLRITETLQKIGLNVSVGVVQHAVFLEAMDNQFDSLQQHMENLVWDNQERLDGWLSGYMGAPSTEYSRCIGRKFLISAVARAYEPGCKVDTVLILRGAQGLGKSTAIEVLAGSDRFTDQLPDLNTKDACIQLLGRHIVEISELAALKRAKNSDMKGFISRTVDHYRAPYATHATNQPRRVVFVGTTNDDEYHSDPTGARRFWDSECTKIDLEALKRDRDQLWAEAVNQYKRGQIWHLTPEEEALAAAEQASQSQKTCSNKAFDCSPATSTRGPDVASMIISVDAAGWSESPAATVCGTVLQTCPRKQFSWAAKRAGTICKNMCAPMKTRPTLRPPRRSENAYNQRR